MKISSEIMMFAFLSAITGIFFFAPLLVDVPNMMQPFVNIVQLLSAVALLLGWLNARDYFLKLIAGSK